MNTSTIREGKRMSLAKVSRGPVAKPLRVVLYGPEGVGKTTFGAGAPGAIFLGSEDGSNTLDVARFPQPKTWGDVRDAVRELLDQPHDFKSLVVDSADWCDPLITSDVCQRAGKASLSSFAFGEGYDLALREWQGFTEQLTALRDVRGMHVIVLAHSFVKTFRNPDGDDFDRHQLKMRDKHAAVLKEWCDALLFANFETLIDDKSGRAKGYATGRRVMYTTRANAHDAKNRYGWPLKLELSWACLDPGALRAEVDALLERVPSDAARAFVAAAGADVSKLLAAKKRLEELAAKKGDE